MEIVKCLPELTKHLEPMASHAWPDHRFCDRYWSQITFEESLFPLTEDRNFELYLDFIADMFMSDAGGLCIGTDTSVYTNATSKKATQSVAAGVLFSQGIEVNCFRWLVGRTTTPDMGQLAICCAIEGTVNHPCRHIAIFTDSIASVKRALDTSLHSSQSHSLRVCKVLETWLEDDLLHWISFHFVPTKLKWRYQHMVHNYAASTYHRPVDFGSWVTFDRLRSESDSQIALHWVQSAASRPQHLGHDFLQLTTLGKKPKPILPSTRKGGPYIRESGSNAASFTSLMAAPCAELLARPALTSSRTVSAYAVI
ncbi:hypothetical protein GALMADRAFT_139348 [Galerina marginata CBS 339.88]|uniref:RNase H type-1 domain-containing protein n=1 Tax=Galerina marginata (strain CBS 339.88) TaxID=685588 RepID=A0A067T2F9_GALM3|nr:hypothetical protein GALMADRAFT_139348 [Galerina marginata CBS 339.88]